MAAFSNSVLPPVVRLGGSLDAPPSNPSHYTAGLVAIQRTVRFLFVPAGEIVRPPSSAQVGSRPQDDSLRHKADDLEPSPAVANRFHELADRWEHETWMLSNSEQATSHPAHVAIVRLGDPVVPLILERMRIRGGHWYHALHDITKEDPVDPADWGNVAAMQSAWLRWGQDNGRI